MDKVQAYPTPKTLKEVQDLVGIWAFGGLLLVPPSILYAT